jgi:diamine N-acetyltransferase
MTPINWRRAGPQDAEGLSLLGQATFLATFAFDHPGPALIEFLQDMHSVAFYAGKLADPDIDIIIGETPLGAPVAYAMLCPPELTEFAQYGDWELKRIYLLGPWQGGGNGKALMEQALSEARERNARRLLLAVYQSNDRGIAFYKRNGFEPIGETVFMVGDVAFRDLVFARVLEKD